MVSRFYELGTRTLIEISKTFSNLDLEAFENWLFWHIRNGDFEIIEILSGLLTIMPCSIIFIELLNFVTNQVANNIQWCPFCNIWQNQIIRYLMWSFHHVFPWIIVMFLKYPFAGFGFSFASCFVFRQFELRWSTMSNKYLFSIISKLLLAMRL